jgi:hypothetical protein
MAVTRDTISRAKVRQTIDRQRERSNGEAFMEGLLAAIGEPTGTASDQWPGMKRAAEHIIANIDTTHAATPHGVIPVNTTLGPLFTDMLAARVRRLVGRLPMVEVSPSAASTLLPRFTTAPTAGPQGGQKTEAYSRAFTIEHNTDPTWIDSSLFLTLSLQLEAVAAGLTETVMRMAVLAEAEQQIAEALVTEGTPATDLDTALAAFDAPGVAGFWTPTMLIVPAAKALAYDVQRLAAVGIETVIVPGVSKPVLFDPAAIIGYVLDIQLRAPEPSVIGHQVAVALWGQVSVTATGAHVIGA